jgi:hypothetical protein
MYNYINWPKNERMRAAGQNIFTSTKLWSVAAETSGFGTLLALSLSLSLS